MTTPPDDRRAQLRAIYDAEFPWVHRTLRRLGARAGDLEDLAHDVFVVAFRALDRYDPARPVRPWLFGIAFRVVSDYRRKASFHREIHTECDEAVGVVAPHQEAALESSRRRALVISALDALSFEQRAVFVAHEIDGTSIADLARSLGVSENTLYSRLRLGRRRFAAAVTRLTARGRT